MGAFNARHPALGGRSNTVSYSGTQVTKFIQHNHLTRWDTGGATHSQGGTLDHILTYGLAASQVKCSSVPALFSDHLALSLQYSIPTVHSSAYQRTCISIPPKYCSNYISYITGLFFKLDLGSPEKLYSSLVSLTHEFYNHYVRRPNIKRQFGAHEWTLERRIKAAERQAVEDSLVYQRDPTPDNLKQYQTSSSALVALQQCVHRDAWHDFTNTINHQTSVGSMWRLIKKALKKKTPSALHHSPVQYAQDLVEAWSQQASVQSLPSYVQEVLSSQKIRRALRLSAALLKKDEEEDIPITKDELRHALVRSKATAPGDDGITYASS